MQRNRVLCADTHAFLLGKVWDKDWIGSDDLIGSLRLPLSHVVAQSRRVVLSDANWYTLVDKDVCVCCV